jgi:hypothetical protein
MKPHHVDSTKTRLSESDILMVAAHEHPGSAKAQYRAAKRPKGVSPERLLYTIFVKLISAPNVVRIREGNTLCAIHSGEDGTAIVYVFDADTASRTIKNIASGIEATRKMGYRKLLAPAEGTAMISLAKRAFNTIKEPGETFNVRGNVVEVGLSNG